MSQTIHLAVADTNIRVAPDERLTTQLIITMAASKDVTPSRYHIALVGLQTSWYELDTHEVELRPGEERRIGLAIQTPAGVPVLSGRYPFRVRLMSGDNHIAASTTVELVVGTRPALTLTVAPVEAVGHAGEYTATLSNGMDWPTTVMLYAWMNTDALSLSMSPPGPIMVPAGAQSRVTLRVAPAKGAPGKAIGTYTIDVYGVVPGREGTIDPDLVDRVTFTPMPAGSPLRHPIPAALDSDPTPVGYNQLALPAEESGQLVSDEAGTGGADTSRERTAGSAVSVLRALLWPIVISLSAIGVSFVTLEDVHSPVRPLLALWFLGICPGMAFARLLGIAEGYIQLTLAIALSLALDTAVATAMMYANLWSPTRTLALLVTISLAGVALDVALSYRQRRILYGGRLQPRQRGSAS